jgi:transcriptional regulator of nitric oxide reductase
MPRLSFLVPWVLAAAALLPATGAAKVFYARDEMRELAFPGATRLQARDLFPTADQRRAIEKQAQSRLESDMLTAYAGYSGDELLGYAFLDTHVVRTLPETFLVVVSPRGEIAALHVMAFYEPLEYLPGERWLKQYERKELDAELRIGRGIAAITGATLSAEAVNGAVRRALAIYHVMLEGH